MALTPCSRGWSWRLGNLVGTHLAGTRLAGKRPGGQHRLAWLLAAAGLLATLGLALGLRLDGLMVLPRLTDETGEVWLGFRVARGEALPLVGVQPYIGALFSYLVAGAFWALGPTIAAGRLIVAWAGALTVIPTFLLGRELADLAVGDVTVGDGADRSTGDTYHRGLVVGLLGALLLAVSAPHILVTSRIAYSNSLTPLCTTVSLWLLARALARQSGASLIGSAFAFGLALQTHLGALALGPGMAAAVLLGAGRQWRDRRWCRPTIVLLALAVGLLATGNLVAFNLTHGLASVDWIGIRSGHYLDGEPFTLDAWGGRLIGLSRALVLALGSQVREVMSADEALVSPLVVASTALAGFGLWSYGRRGVWLPLLMVVSVLLTVSALNARVEPIVPRVRHYAMLLPLGAVLVAEGLVRLREVAGRLTRATWLADAALLLAALGLTVGPLFMLHTYADERLSRSDKNNRAYLAVLDAVEQSGSHQERVYLDTHLAELRTLSGGRMLDHLRVAFAMVGQEYDTIDLDLDPSMAGRSIVAPRRLLLAPATIPSAEQRFRLVPLSGEPGEDGPLRAFRAFPLRRP